jgi:hypothetical protein
MGSSRCTSPRGKDPWVPWRPVRKKAQLMIDALIRGLTVPVDRATPASSETIGTITIPSGMEDLT